MKKYRAVVIDGKKIINQFLKAVIFFIITALVVTNIKFSGLDLSIDSKTFGQRVIDESLPQISARQEDSLISSATSILKGISQFFLTFDIFDPRTVVLAQVPLLKQVDSGYLAQASNSSVSAVFNPKNADLGEGTPEPVSPEGGTYPITAVDSSQEAGLKNSKNKILIRNETSFGINIEEFLNSPLTFDMEGDGPKVLIIHTHTTESYSPQGSTTYDSSKGDRSLDESQNMIAVGRAVKEVFDRHHIEAIHDTTLHDHPSFNGSYENSLNTIERYKSKYPSIRIVLDLHRDAFIYDNGSKAKFVTKIDGEDTAQLMLVVGTNGGGLDHPKWRENMKLALKLQNAITQKYPSLMRGVNLRKERFNGHTTCGSMIIEVGSSGNTLAEAIRGATLGAAEICNFLNSL